MKHECIDPDLGQELWRLDDPDTAPELKRVLEQHCHHCSACASNRAIARALDRAVGEGMVDFGRQPARPRRWPLWSSSCGALALAASLTLVVLLPPTSPTMRSAPRGAQPPAGIIRPVAGEVVVTSQPTIRWTPLERARSYVVSVTTEDGDEKWRTRTEATEARPGDADALATPGRYRVWVEPVPSHLAASGSFGHSFVRGDVGEMIRYRFRHAARWIVAIGGLGIVLLALGFARLAADRRRAASA